jgi:mono/diheme cytochrome c family protein
MRAAAGPIPGRTESMSKRTFVTYGLLVALLAIVIPWLAFRSRGDAETGVEQVPASLAHGQDLFQINCGTCHTLASAGTDGNFAPDLDALLAPGGPVDDPATLKGRVLNAIENGVDGSTTPGRMPAGIISGAQAEQVAEFVAQTAGRG